MFFVKTVPVERTHESADDMTAAETAPIPIILIGRGHRYWSTRGRMKLRLESGMGISPSYNVWFQSKA